MNEDKPEEFKHETYGDYTFKLDGYFTISDLEALLSNLKEMKERQSKHMELMLKGIKR